MQSYRSPFASKLYSALIGAIFLLGVVLLVLYYLFSFTNQLSWFTSRYIVPLSNRPTVVKLADSVPESTDKIYLDINQDGFAPSQFVLKSGLGIEIPLDETPYGYSVALNVRDFDSNFVLSISTMYSADVDVLLTFASAQHTAVGQKREKVHFNGNETALVTLEILLLSVGSTLISFSVLMFITRVRIKSVRAVTRSRRRSKRGFAHTAREYEYDDDSDDTTNTTATANFDMSTQQLQLQGLSHNYLAGAGGVGFGAGMQTAQTEQVPQAAQVSHKTSRKGLRRRGKHGG
jgi:hypothetical protein